MSKIKNFVEESKKPNEMTTAEIIEQFGCSRSKVERAVFNGYLVPRKTGKGDRYLLFKKSEVETLFNKKK